MKDWRPRLSSIEAPIPEDYWHYMIEDGTRRTSLIIIGRPALAPDGKTWYCPLSFEHVGRGIKYSFGVGALGHADERDVLRPHVIRPQALLRVR